MAIFFLFKLASIYALSTFIILFLNSSSLNPDFLMAFSSGRSPSLTKEIRLSSLPSSIPSFLPSSKPFSKPSALILSLSIISSAPLCLAKYLSASSSKPFLCFIVIHPFSSSLIIRENFSYYLTIYILWLAL